MGQLFFPCIEEAQRHELAEIFLEGNKLEKAKPEDFEWTPDVIAKRILSQQDKIVDILTTTPKSKVKARKINGGTKRRKKMLTVSEANAEIQRLEANAAIENLNQ